MTAVKEVRSLSIEVLRFLLITMLFAICAASIADESVPATAWTPPPMPEPSPYGEVNLSPEQVKSLREDWGVEVLGLRLASANMMIDFRFRVVDVDKAISLFDHQIKPHLIVDRSNIKLPVPMAAKVGAFRPTNRGKNIKADRNYYMIFGNPDRHVKAGETVTIVIGDFRVEHLVVNG